MSPLATSRLARSRLVDRLVAGVITLGGSLVLLAVAFLMVFLVAQCLPLVGAGTSRHDAPAASRPEPLVAFEDEYRERLGMVWPDGSAALVDREGASRPLATPAVTPPLRQGVASRSGELLALEDAEGRLLVWAVRSASTWEGEHRRIETSLRAVFTAPMEPAGRLLAVSGSAADPHVLIASPHGAILASPSGEALEFQLGASATAGALTRDASEAWVVAGSELAVFSASGSDAARPLATVPLPTPATAATLMVGDVTCLVGDASGAVTAWQLLAGPVAGTRVLGRAGVFPGAGAVRALAVSERNKSFAVARDGGISLFHLTTRRRLFDLPSVPADVMLFSLSRRFDGAWAVARGGEVHRWELDVPHPEVSAGVLFLPVRYEGYTRPTLVWQSTGFDESAEPKLSLVPLILGTLKGALYALLFSAPCALAAALYIAQLAPARLRAIVKPAIELMAALPSVVVGFIAAVLLAPVLQRHLVGTLTVFVALPIVVVLAAASWSLAPQYWRHRLTAGRELGLVLGLLAVAIVASYLVEGPLERALFGGDLTHWLLASAGITYDQRNAIVVGFALGFAVIPIIFTLAEDAFSNVPQSLISASLALGASQWQAARTVAIPAASPGLFAAVMTGLGRAVGETMIVLMATGNTPILSLLPFNGMRTMSACIAVELPEAPFGGSLYRVLILTALLLFVMTFVINTAAVMVSARLRKRFGRLAA
ncbi:MAG TPA: ABC transporter permease subunit [Thermoanaerobaculaceae bacterium]|nr:ABC transporter permease subunit [Thermoanaerobaculaceae bacterium]HRS14665.1 ABC transporter permease subunit [Thermoanaerobaculaceae bacterium]